MAGAAPAASTDPAGASGAGWALVAVAVCLVLGLHLRSAILAWSDPDRLVEYVSSPPPFWLVKLLDLGIVVPVALATGVGLLGGAAWADRTAYVVLTGYTLPGRVGGEHGLIMYANGDPDVIRSPWRPASSDKRPSWRCSP